jgi:acyl carrier protein
MTIMEKLTDIFRTVFDDDSIEINRGTTAQDVDGWDSLSHVTLIVFVENSFQIKFAQKDLLTFRCVGDLHDMIQVKLSGKTDPLP